jgi:hypothetical protein
MSADSRTLATLALKRIQNFVDDSLAKSSATLDDMTCALLCVLDNCKKEQAEEKAMAAARDKRLKLLAKDLLFTTFNELKEGAHFICMRDSVEQDVFSKRKFLVQTKLEHHEAKTAGLNAVDGRGSLDSVDDDQVVIEVYFAGDSLWIDR